MSPEATVPQTGALLCLCTCPDDASATRLARSLVEENLAACVNRLPGVTSTYRWQGQIVDETEVLLLIKTSAAQYPALAARLPELHPYSVPELIALSIDSGLPEYLAWVLNPLR